MIKIRSKTVLLILVISLTALGAKAQAGYNFAQYDIGTSIALNKVYGDAETLTTEPAINFNFTYNPSPFTNFVFEVQLGKLRGGDSLLTRSGRYFNNDFSAYIFRGQLQLGEIIDYSRSPFNNAIKNLYISAGAGFIHNHITQVSRTSKQVAGYFTDGEDKSSEPFIPLRVGYEFKFYNSYAQPSVKLDIGYGYNLILGDGIDGFSAGSHHDVYSQYTIGVKFAIGQAVISYRKQITY